MSMIAKNPKILRAPRSFGGSVKKAAALAALVVLTTLTLAAVPSAAVARSVPASRLASLSPASTPGAKLWATRFPRFWARALGVSPDGSAIFVTGIRTTPGSTSEWDYFTVAYDASNRAVLWTARYKGPTNDEATALGVSPDGSEVFVTGYFVESNGFDHGYATVAYDASTGAKLWAKRSDKGDFGTARALGVSPNGSEVFVAGGSATVAYDASTGAKLWAKRQNFPQGEALGVSPDGSAVFVTGGGYATVAYDAATGAELWAANYIGPMHKDNATALGVSRDGSAVFVTGTSVRRSSVDYPPDEDYATVAYDAGTGTELWVTRFNSKYMSGETGTSYDVPSALGVSPDGSAVFVTGNSPGPRDEGDYVESGYATFAYDASTGTKLWGRRYDGPGAEALGVSPDGSTVFVTGGGPCSTVAYETSSGAELWARRWRSSSGGAALGVGPDGSAVFVSGTVAYRAS